MEKVSEEEKLNEKIGCDLSYFKLPRRKNNRPFYGNDGGLRLIYQAKRKKASLKE